MFLTDPQGDVLRREQHEASPLKLKFSEAIRIGAKLRPQARGFLFLDGRSCALGAAYEGIGRKPVEYRTAGDYHGQYDVLYERFGYELCNKVFKRNDAGDTREQIADWLESQGL